MAISSDILNASILIVDDRKVNVELIYCMLSNAGYTSLTSTVNPLEVCDLHRANEYDLILLDLMMPKMDGFQVMEGLKLVESEIEQKTGPKIESDGCLPVLVITAQPEHKERALQAGAKGFISKPFDRLEVLTHIRDVLEIRLLQKELQQFITSLEVTLSERTAPLRETEELFYQLAGNLPQVFWVWDVHDQTFRYINPAWEKMTGRRVAPGDKLDKFFAAVHPEDMQRVIREASELSRRSVDHDYRLLLPDNTVRWVHTRTFPIKDSKGVHRVVGITDDITHRKGADQRLLQLAHYDSLTDLPNRNLFDESLQKIIKQAEMNHRTISVLFLDIDNFKKINDDLGRAIGDELLRQFSRRLLECLRVTDMVARLGGDEFGCILVTPDGSGDAGVVASKIREALRQPFNLLDHEITVTASIGISVYPTDSLDADALVQNGGTAMYRSKEAGRDTYRFFTAEMNARAIEKLDQENALRRALDLNEFVLYYQPKVELSMGRITGVEALIRWRRPGHGLIAPLEFISVLEQTGLISEVGAWVIESACKQISKWRRSGIGEIPVSVNVSGRQFSQGTLNQDIIRATQENDVHPELLEFELQTERALRENSIDSDLLELEMTESSLMTHAKKTAGILQRLKLLGIRISIDDFGTGYSSLAYVRRLPIDVLKIDRSFIAEITTNSADAAITTAIIEMAHSLNVKVVAEGVETVEQLDFLRERGCDEIQGYYFARPLPAHEIAKLLLSGNRFLKPAQSLIV
ncbi:PAS domain S-box-containing protein/diguanylate cyclase (GGDEF) domain-containing protein [Nitrosospira briensis]|uniref:PAS domain S-box-containing protein/diguanylate cyclase (GGDEF) domain-containing protein n=1 Tax=Nitrosospira briensis TaxID=35799 RepID=A0A1I4XTP3_9PROT|nr:EAL domain-containing protein [Nitrosospira briensis]SFN29248.1 PAS domain S-box-containing protein/diguanylate cyclase (GGDEF) domain-containing protein [Nitrosospira briensis]